MFILLMTTELKTKFPWITEKNNFTTKGTDDYDSFILWNALREVNDWQLNQFYSFDKLWTLDTANTKEVVGCDLCVPYGKTIDNHVSMFFRDSRVNKESINPNAIYAISGDNYGKKYAMSSTLIGWAALDIPLPKTDIAKAFLVALDVGHKGHFSGFKKTHNEWLEKLGYTELIDLLNKYDKEYFDNIITEMKSKGDFIRINENGFMETGSINLDNLSRQLGIKLEVPTEQFTLVEEYQTGYFNRYDNKQIEKDEKTVSYALTYKNNGSYTYIK